MMSAYYLKSNVMKKIRKNDRKSEIELIIFIALFITFSISLYPQIQTYGPALKENYVNDSYTG